MMGWFTIVTVLSQCLICRSTISFYTQPRPLLIAKDGAVCMISNEKGWALLGLNQRPPDYESDALTN